MAKLRVCNVLASASLGQILIILQFDQRLIIADRGKSTAGKTGMKIKKEAVMLFKRRWCAAGPLSCSWDS
jgi:hypothetical protein